MSERPCTSRPRGICKYYRSSRGCRNGEACKFLHGDNETLSPYDKNKTCRFYAAGFCKHGDKCWFRHVDIVGEEFGSHAALSGNEPASPGAEDEDSVAVCSICQEKPVTYGLLEGCSHVFCLECIRGWRDPTGKSYDIMLSGNTKRCPYCRTSSKFVTPSSIFYPSGDPLKAMTIDSYKASMKRIPCKYFEASRPGSRFCPFGKDCFYQHKELDGTDFVFPFDANHYMSKRSRRRTRRADADLVDLLVSLQQVRLDLDMLPAAVELRADLRGRFEHAFSRFRRNLRDASPTIAYNFRTLIEERLESIDTRTVASEDEQDEHVEETHVTSSILATPEDSASALPLTRAFMARNIPSEFIDYLSDVPESEDGDHDHYEILTRPRLAPFRRHSVPDLASVLDYTGEPDILVQTEESDGTNITDSGQSSLDSFGYTHADEVQRGSVFGDLTPSDDAVTPFSEPSNSSPVQNSVPNELSNDQESSDGERSALSTDLPPSGDEHRGQDNESRRKLETRSDFVSRRAKSSSNVSSCNGRRNGGQSFVTDGRGRVVATDDLAYTDSASVALWSNPVSAVLPRSDSASEMNEQALAGHGPLDDLD